MKLKLLLIDDDEVFLMMTRKMVEISGFYHSPLSFKNGLAASDFLRKQYQENETYVLFLDINMPIMDGWEFLETLQGFANPSNTFVFMVTSSTDKADISKADKNPFVLNYLSKPVLVDTLKNLKTFPQLRHFFT